MTYSFIEPKIKPLISLFTKIWIVFFAVCLGIIISIYSFANTRLNILNAQIKEKVAQTQSFHQQTRDNDALFELLTSRKNLAIAFVGAQGANANLEKVVKNLLDFIVNSNSIKLEYMYLDGTALELRGITPTKELFTLLIQTPLKSIFDTSSVNFFPLENGWFKFVNINEMRGE